MEEDVVDREEREEEEGEEEEGEKVRGVEEKDRVEAGGSEQKG